MKRRFASLVHPIATCLTLVALLLIPASCSKEQAPIIAPNGAMTGSKTAPSRSGEIVVKDQGILKFAPGVNWGSVLAANDLVLVSVLVMGTNQADWFYLVRTEDGSDFAEKSFNAAQVAFSGSNKVIWISDDDVVQPDRDGLTFDDTHSWRTATEYLNQPAFSRVRLDQARSVSEGPGVVIALMDTGVDQTHPLFQNPHFYSAGNYSVMPPVGGTLDQVNNPADDDADGYPNDGVGHGTYVAGLLYTAARQATIRVYKVLDDEGRGTTFGLAKAMKAAVTANVDVINCSLGFLDGATDQMMLNVVQDALDHGITIVASAGNRNSTELQYPAAYFGVVSVSAVDNADVRYIFASHGSTVSLTAPGVDVISAIPSYYGSNKYAATCGTSAAVPWVAGTIAVTKVARNTTTAQAAVIVKQTAVNTNEQNPGIGLGSGRIDMAEAAGWLP